MREVVARADGGDATRALALGVYLHRLRAGDRRDGRRARTGSTRSSSRAASASARRRSCARAQPTASASSASRSTPRRNAAADGDADVSLAGAPVRTLVVPAREDLEIARGVRAVLG